MNESVAVVGGAGFLGANVVVELAEAGYRPIVVSRSPERIKRAVPEMEIETRYGDITKLETLRPALKGCTYVHTVAALLGEIFTDPNPNHREAAVRVNVDGTVNVLRAALENGVKRVVATSSASTRYQPGGVLANEDSPALGYEIVPDSYVRSKVLEEKAIGDFSQRTGLEVVTILPGGLFGPRDGAPSLIGTAIVARLNGDPTAGVGFSGSVPFVDVRDVARAHVRAMEVESPRDAYLLVAEQIEMADWQKVLDRVTGVPVKARIVPVKAAMPMALAFEAMAWLRRKPALMNRNTIRHTIQRQQYDCTRAREELGIIFTSSETTMRDMVRWFVDNGYVTNEENLAILQRTLATADAMAAGAIG
jgi:dihydroflavonol-4-reductase